MAKKQILVVMSAILPTTGHTDLVNWAAEFAVNCNADLHVVISSRDCEPTTGWSREDALKDSLPNWARTEVHFHRHRDDAAPQAPRGPNDAAFWVYWCDTVRTLCEVTKFNYVISSEEYGAPFAEALGAMHIPYDVKRSRNSARGTTVRAAPYKEWHHVAPGARQGLVTVGTVFGQESVGKTTLVNKFPCWNSCVTTTPEWARPYLEAVGPELTEAKMEAIVWGQAATQGRAWHEAKQPWILQDTDLFSTLGYYRINGMKPPASLEATAQMLASHIYFLVEPTLPFVPNPLRYGGDKRESTFQFWGDLLEEFNLPYTVIKPDGCAAIQKGMTEAMDRRLEAFTSYVRD